jgi:hypothetical protein
LNISNYSVGAWIYLNVSYEDSEIYEESRFKLYRYNGSNWTEIPGSSVDTINNVVYGNLTNFSVFAPFERAIVCGDGLVEGAEVCESGNLSGETCVSQGYDSGTLSCLSDCSGYNTTNCSTMMKSVWIISVLKLLLVKRIGVVLVGQSVL